MRSVKQKLSLVLVLALLVNMLLPGMGAFAAETNNFVVPGSGEQILISPDTSNWGEQTSTTESNAGASSQFNNDKEEAIGNQILDSNKDVIGNDVEIQGLPAVVAAALAWVAKKLAVKVYNKVWPIIKDKLTKVVKDVANKYNDLTVEGPGRGEQVFALKSKKHGHKSEDYQVFRLDIKLLKKYDGYYIWPHYHIKPNLNDHNNLAPGDGYIYWGKDKPPGFGWQNI